MGFCYNLLAPRTENWWVEGLLNKQEDWLELEFHDEQGKYYSYRIHAPEDSKITVILEQLRMGLAHSCIPIAFTKRPYLQKIRKALGWKAGPFDFVPPPKAIA